MSQPGLASLELCTAGAGTAAIPAEDRRAQGPHLHADDQDAGCAGGLPEPARLHIPAPGRHHQARAAAGASRLLWTQCTHQSMMLNYMTVVSIDLTGMLRTECSAEHRTCPAHTQLITS